MAHFHISDEALAHLKSRDKQLAGAIEAIGPLQRGIQEDLFPELMNAIVGQQISTKAQVTIWGRIAEGFAAEGGVTPATIAACSEARLQGYGISFRKARYMQSTARRVLTGELDIEALWDMPDDEVCAALCRLDGIGVWTAEMLMTFSMQRPDVVSWGDLAIQRGMRMLYRHRQLTRPLFDKYRRRYSPYGSVASLYLWAIAGGAIEGLTDPAARSRKKDAKR